VEKHITYVDTKLRDIYIWIRSQESEDGLYTAHQRH
jgi:hypothetical protein